MSINRKGMDIFWRHVIERDVDGMWTSCEQNAHMIAGVYRRDIHQGYNEINDFSSFAGSAAMNSVDVLLYIKRKVWGNRQWQQFAPILLSFLENDVKALAQKACEEQGIRGEGDQIQARKYLYFRAIDLIALHIRGISIELGVIR